MKLIENYKFRQWLYGVLAALFVVLGGYGFLSAEEQDNYLQLAVAVLNIGGSAGFGLAASRTNPPEEPPTRGKHVDE